MNLTLKHIAEIIDAKPSGADLERVGHRRCSTLLTDSRSLIEPDTTLFLALHTAVNDGHKYISDLYLKGVRSFVVERLDEQAKEWPDAVFLVVPSVVEALQKLGEYARSQYKGRVVAITGSQYKTLFKEILYDHLIANGVNAYHSPRSWNSQIGVPLALWKLPENSEEADVAIIEAGIDHAGEMATLARMIRPNVGVLTTITDEHSAGFASEDEKLAEKLTLFDTADKIYVATNHPEGLYDRVKALMPGKTVKPSIPREPISEELRGCAMSVTIELTDAGGMTYCRDEVEFQTRIDVHDGVNNCIIVSDYFTNDPESLREALDFTRRRADGRPISLILGKVRYSHSQGSREIYEEAARLAELFDVKRLFLCGDFDDCVDCFNPAMLQGEYSGVGALLANLGDDFFDNETILVKGDKTFRDITHHLESPRHDTDLEINLNSLVHNYNHYRSLLKPTTGIICMVKASAYGTGAVEVARTLQAQGAAYLAVAVVDEGVDLRRAGITMPIVVLNPITSNYRSLFNYSLQPAVFSMDELHRLKKEARAFSHSEYPVHIKFDTGMHRVGFLEEDIPALAHALAEDDTLHVVSAFSHLATADCVDQNDYTQMQLDAFTRMTDELRRLLGYDFKRHILNTAGIQRFPEYQFDMVRLGVGLYGIDPLGDRHAQGLLTVASLTSTIISLKHWPKGTPIGYGRRGRTERDAIIATIPIGYADGMNRHLGCGRGRFVVNGRLCPTVGNICMDLCMIDVTDAKALIGDRVEIFGVHAPIEKVAKELDTIPYEVLTAVSPRVKRIYYRE